jgi:hypothetical protein
MTFVFVQQKKKEERPDGGYVSVEEAKALTERIGALGYFECSGSSGFFVQFCDFSNSKWLLF